MKVKKGKGMVVTAVKRAVSLPRSLDEKVQQISRENHQPYSVVVRSALNVFIERLRENRLESVYRDYYQGERAKAAEESLTDEFSNYAKENWSV